MIPAFVLEAGHPENIDQPVSGPIVSRAEITVGQTATVIAQDIVDGRVDTRHGMNTADRDAYGSTVIFGEDGEIEVEYRDGDTTWIRLAAPAQQVKASIALSWNDGDFQNAYLDVESTGDFTIHVRNNMATVLQVVNVQSGTLSLAPCRGNIALQFGAQASLTFNGPFAPGYGDDAEGLLGAVESGSGDCGDDAPTISISRPEVFEADWNTAPLIQKDGHFRWRVAPGGGFQVLNPSLEVRVSTFASFGYDEASYEVKGTIPSWNCDETGDEDTIQLDRDGDRESRCGVGDLTFETLGSKTFQAAAEDASGTVQREVQDSQEAS